MSEATGKKVMEQVFALWKAKSKKGDIYFTGKYEGSDIRGFYNKPKQNPKEPDLRVYKVDQDKKLEKDELLSLWCNANEKGKKYLSGKLGDKRVVGFINEEATEENKKPYISVYFSNEAPKKVEEKKTEKKNKIEKDSLTEVDNGDLPF